MAEEEAGAFDPAVYGTLTAYGFMLENLFATVIDRTGGTVEDARAARDDMLRQFEELPWRSNIADGEMSFVIRQHALHRLERMWRAIEGRLV